MPSYRLFRENVAENISEHFTYGIITPSGIQISDIAEIPEPLELFLKELNQGQAEEIHIYDLLEDWINEMSML